ncbi:MAG: hypothetical protein KatS3mg111_0446 [Pirellulaceae bacterium]|nr:MAG: hypothetical protein KatS3mg111_0446 [Pirellulaceae bacterium]
MVTPRIRHTISVWTSTLTFLVSTTSLGLLSAAGQSGGPPRPLATSQAGDYRIELFVAEKSSRPLIATSPMFLPFAMEAERTMQTPQGIPTWKSESPRGFKDEWLLGFVVRDLNGLLPNKAFYFASAYRLSTESGEQFSVWPTFMETPLAEVCHLDDWNYDLRPLEISLPRDTTRLSRLEGFLVEVPQETSEYHFTKEEMMRGELAGDGYGGFSVTQVQVEPQGLGIDLLGTTITPGGSNGQGREASAARRDATDLRRQMQEGGMQHFTAAVETSTGERVAASAYGALSVSRTLKAQFATRLRVLMRDQGLATSRTARINATTDVQAIRLFFPNVRDFEKLTITVLTITGQPRLIPFEMSDIDLAGSNSPASIQAMMAELREKSAAQWSKEAAKKGTNTVAAPRLWRDSTGRFSVTASLVRVDDASVALRKENGEQITVPIVRLSAADQEFVRSLEH